MKKAVFAAACLLILLCFCGCKPKEINQMETTPKETITIINEFKQADVWLLPETEQNLKTTLWGTATASNVQKGESRSVALCEPGENGLYILRMIDTDHGYYAADGIALEAGQTLQLTRQSDVLIALCRDKSGKVIGSYEVFHAAL